MGGISIWQLLIIVVIVLLLFGTKKLRNMGSDAGAAVKGFRDAMRDGEKDAAAKGDSKEAEKSGKVIEGEVTRKEHDGPKS